MKNNQHALHRAEHALTALLPHTSDWTKEERLAFTRLWSILQEKVIDLPLDLTITEEEQDDYFSRREAFEERVFSRLFGNDCIGEFLRRGKPDWWTAEAWVSKDKLK